jgi:protein-tyrosine phosphatase
MTESWFVDCHSHMCPSGDDGVTTVEEGAILSREAHRHGTAILFATPHVWPHMPLTPEREALVRRHFDELRPRSGLDLRLGWELTPARPLLDQDLHRYELGDTGCVLIEVPFDGPADLLWAVAGEAERQGLSPVIAHPERTEAVMADESLADALGERYLLQVNATSLTGRHGRTQEAIGWRLVEEGRADLVASDGHRSTRPPFLDAAYEATVARIGDAARRLFDGSSLGLSEAARPAPSRGAPQGA